VDLPLLWLGEWRCVDVEGVEEFRVGLTAPTAPVPGHLVTQNYPLSAETSHHFFMATTHKCGKI